ncbi:MAG: hypothetical protein PHE55_23040 [Methylococcaceae bacterium]|nr:hypothetical protein [Methylococcaceae bacterium]
MAKSDFVPTADNDFLAWLEPLAANAVSHQAELGLSATDQGGGNVMLGFSKLRTDGVNIYAFDEATGQFRFLARDTQQPYVDNRPLAVPGKPELRRYKAIYVLGDEEIGLFSDEVVVNCTP